MEPDTQTSERAAEVPCDHVNATCNRRLAAVLSADVAGYSRLMGDDDESTVRQLQECRTVFRETIERLEGTVIDTAGDSVLAELPSAVNAVQCARAIQRELATLNTRWSESRRMLFRIGINLGDIIVEPDGTIYGDGVNIAARVESLATPGGFSVSGTVFDQVDAKIDQPFDFAGEHTVKNITRPVRIYRAKLEDKPTATARAAVRDDRSSCTTILIVDDNDDNRYTLSRRLRKEGFGDALVAQNGLEALEQLRTHSVALVLLDIMMPEMNGYQVLEHMRADTRLREVPVVMISAVEDMDSVVRCIELGAEDYLSKPFNPTILRARVKACLEKARLRRVGKAHGQKLATQKKRVDRILRSLLPSGAVQRLRSGKETLPESYQDVGVLCCEVVDFAERCEEESPRHLLSELRPVVDALESAMDEQGLEALSGPAGSWIAAAGMYHLADDGALACTRAGLRVLEAARRLRPRWDVRVAVHQGTVTAGILGRNHCRFAAWGRCIETVRRVAQASHSGELWVTGPVWEVVSLELDGVSRGLVDSHDGPIEALTVNPSQP